MQNLIAFLVFQVVGLGIFSLFSPLFKFKGHEDKGGTFIFWGFWMAMLLTYLLALIIPKHLNMACYLVFIASLLGIGKITYQGKIIEIINANYIYCILCLLPFVFFLTHQISICDEYGHWVYLPKIYYHTNEFVTEPLSSGPGYTPLWTLQAVFFEFFIPGYFSESVIAVIKMGIFVSFLFFLKETLNTKTFVFLIFSIAALIFTTKFNKHLLVEFPLYILITSLSFLVYAIEKKEDRNLLFLLLLGTLSAYMVKKSMLVIFPSVIWYLWVKNYKKELIALLLVFFFFAIPWKIINLDKSELLSAGRTINSFTNHEAMQVYSMFFEKLKEEFVYFLALAASLYLLFRESKRLFIFYALFSFIFIFALIMSYLFSFRSDEALAFASFRRYLSTVFYPAYILGAYIIISKFSEQIEARGEKWGRKGIAIGVIFLSVIIGGTYFYQGYKQTQKDHIRHFVSKINTSPIPYNKNILIIGPPNLYHELFRYRYHFYPAFKSIQYQMVEAIPDRNLEKMFMNFDLIIVNKNTPQIHEFIKNNWGIDSQIGTAFYLYKRDKEVVYKSLGSSNFKNVGRRLKRE